MKTDTKRLRNGGGGGKAIVDSEEEVEIIHTSSKPHKQQASIFPTPGINQRRKPSYEILF